MVVRQSIQLLIAVVQPLCWLFAEAEKPLLQRLPPVVRARVILALVGLVMLAVLTTTMIWLVGRYWRRQIRKPLPPVHPHQDDWASKPLVSDKPPVSDQLR